MDPKTKANLLQAALIVAAVCTSGAERFGDFNGDGKADLLLRHSDGSWRYHTGDGASAAPGEPLRITTKLAWYWAGAGDFNGDGRDDIMLRREDGVWVYYPLDGTRVIAGERGWANLTRNLDFRVVGIGDFNADGRDDVLMRRTDGAWAYYPMNGRRVIRAEAGWANLPREVDWRVAGVGDFNGDGQADVLLRHIDGAWRHYAMDGRRIVPGQSRTAHLPRDLRWRLAGIGDFHGDGRDSVLLRHADGRWRHENVDGTGGGVSLSRDWAWRLAAVGDGDGDGRDDVVLRHDDGRWRRHLMVGHRAQRGTELNLPQTHAWAPPTRPVYIPDAKLRGTFKDALGKAGGQPVRAREMAALKVLHAVGMGILDLTGIGSAIGLSVLRLDRNEIRDISPLAGLVGLRTLSLTRNRIEDVSVFKGIPDLEDLNLGANQIADISPLRGLTGLLALNLGANAVEDLSPLADMAAVTRLWLNNNRLEDVTPLAGLSGLRRLWLSGNVIRDVSPLSGLLALQSLFLGDNKVKDVSPLADLPVLTSLGLQRNEFDSLSSLAKLTRLTWLFLDGNDVEDLSPLASLSALTELGLRDNDVEDVTPLAGLTQLRRLWLAGNRIMDVSPLASLARLERLGLARNRTLDIAPLGKLTSLTGLWLGNNDIEEISPLAGLKELEELHMESNSVSDIAALAGLVNLDELNLAYNRIADLGPLADNVGLEEGDHVDVRGNPLNDQSIGMVVPTLVARGVRMDVSARARLELTYGDSVQVMHVGEDLATLDLFSGLPLDLYSAVLFSRFKDVFDFIMFFSNLDDIDEHEHSHYYGVYSSVRNDTAGVGLRTFYDNRYGSAETLKGVIHFPYNRALRFGPSLHEILHAWANYTIPSAVGAHWGFSSANGQLGGFDIGNLVELGDNRFAAGRFGTFANGGNRPGYSPIELYFAGYIPPEEVQDLWVAADGEWVVEDGDLPRTEDGHRIFTARDVRTYSIEDIVAKAGPRTPSMADAQWDFRVAVVLLTDDDHAATDEQLALLSDHAAWFSLPARDESHLHNFFEATGGRGTVTMNGLSQYQKAIPAAATGLPASFGIVPEPRVTLLDGRCLPLSSARTATGSELHRDVGAHGRLFIGER